MRTIALVAVLLSASSFGFAAPTKSKTVTAPTADDSKNNKADLDLTAQIRRAVVADKGLSINAHNVKIIVQDGFVTLKGPVNTAAESASVEQKALEIAGRTKVKNELEIKP